MPTIADILLETASSQLPPGPPMLGVASDGREYRFFFKPKAGVEQPLASSMTPLLNAELASTTHEGAIFTGIYLAMDAPGNGTPNRQPADFDWFKYQSHGS